MENMTGLIGQTPLLLCGRLMKKENSVARILAKLEYLNPTGSLADRMAKAVIDDGIRQGRLGPDTVIIQATWGEMGIGIAGQAVLHGFSVIVVMPDNVSQEYRTIIRAYGAQIVLTEAAKGIKGAVEKARDISRVLSGSFLSFQHNFEDRNLNPQDCVGLEIWEDTGGQVDLVVGAVETGGSLWEAGEFLKSRRRDIQVVGVKLKGEPGNSLGVFDEEWLVDTDKAAQRIRMVGQTEGILVGKLSGAVLEAAVQISRREENRDKMVVAILPDSADRYYSTNMFIDTYSLRPR
ncbi:MAG: PLP-dependent cysteine synthase family protein [Lachnospiraceae bacterium]